MSKFRQFLIGGVLVVIGINMVGLWSAQYLALRKLHSIESSKRPVKIAQFTQDDFISPTVETQVVGQETGQEVDAETEEDSLFDSIQETLASLTKRVVKLEEAAQTNVPATAAPASKATSSTTKKEEILTIGSGEKGTTQWADVPSLLLEVNSYNYQDVKEVRFEAALSVVSGVAEARLINNDSESVIHGSELNHNSSTPTIKLSSPFNLNQGSVTYQIQVRSSSGETVSVDNAKLRLSY